MKGFIQKYILPREVDFNAALREQVCAVRQCAWAHHLKEDPVRDYLARREIIAQLKEVARRIRVSAGSLEDMAVKSV